MKVLPVSENRRALGPRSLQSNVLPLGEPQSLLFSCHLLLSVTVIDYLQPVTWAGEEGCVVQQEGSGLFTVAWQKGRGVRVSPNIRELQEGISGLASQGL